MSDNNAAAGRPLLILLGLVPALAAAILFVCWWTLSPKTGTVAGPSEDAWTSQELLTAPEFSLTERSGRTITRADLAGKIWIADFIFTRCGSICPDLTRRMALARKELAARGAGDVMSVSFSVDPLFDTPPVLDAYARQFGVDDPNWLFLTGDPKEMLRIVTEGFRLAMANPEEGEPVHTDQFVLVDGNGRIRAMQHALDEGEVEALVREAIALRAKANG